MIDYSTFEKLDLRVGTILNAKDFPKAKKPAYKLEIDFGPIEPRLFEICKMNF